MWTRFPPRMRRIIYVALEEAGQRGRDAAGAEDLVLAVCADPASGGAIVLGQCGLNVSQVAEKMNAVAANGRGRKQRAELLEPSALQLLQLATSESQRLGHDHVGTEHIALALAQPRQLAIAQPLQQMGLTPAAAETAVCQWIKHGMPRGDFQLPYNRFLRVSKTKKLKTLLRLPELAWKIFVRKSLGHPGFVSNPYPLYHWLRSREPARKDPLAPIWILTRYEDVAAMMREPKYRKDPFAEERLPGKIREQLGVVPERVDSDAISMLFLDPPQHTRIRAAFARAFTPASLADLRLRIELICRKQLDRVHASGRMELIGDLAYPLPVFVIAEILGFPAEDYEKFKRWSDEMTASLALNAKPEHHMKAAEARGEIHDYFDRILLTIKSRAPDSLIGRLLETEGQPGGLSREEIFTNAVLLLAAGHETTTNLIGNGILAFMRNRDQWEQLVAEPALVESAVEEMLRFDSPVQWASRLTGEPIEIAGTQIPEHQVILGCLGAANRDPAKFPNPDQFNIRRPDNKHLSFGTGIHFCLGAALARMEAQIVLSNLIERYPKMKWDGRKINWMKGLTFRGVKGLQLALR